MALPTTPRSQALGELRSAKASLGAVLNSVAVATWKGYVRPGGDPVIDGLPAALDKLIADIQKATE